jgi:uncharacterized RDD family membrane protein YckC
MENRNPYLVLGIPYGADRSTAARAYTRTLRRVRSDDSSPVTLEELSWALHEIEQAIPDPDLHGGYLRVPAVPEAYEVLNADPVVVPRTPPLPRTSDRAPARHRQRTAELAITEARDALVELTEQLAPKVAVPDLPVSEPVPPPRSTSHRPERASTAATTSLAGPSSSRAEGRSNHGSPWPSATATESMAATVGLRVAARAVDLVLVGIVAALFVGDSEGAWQSLTFLLFFVYSVALETLYGQTIGKRFFGFRVVSTRGELSPEQSAKRNGVFLIGVIPAIGWFLALLASAWAVITASSRASQRGFHDEFSGTLVVAANEQPSRNRSN